MPTNDYNDLLTPFRPEEHEVRVLQQTKSGKAKWYVYIQRQAIIRRLLEVYGMGWALSLIELRQDTDPDGGHYAICTLRLTIGETWHDEIGEGSGNTAGNNVKAAYTDALKRAFSSFGGGLYLYDALDIWTDGFDKGEWDKMRAMEQEALKKVYAWLGTLGVVKTPQIAPQSETAPQSTSPQNSKRKQPAWWSKVVAGVKNLEHFAGETKHVANALNALLDDGTLTVDMSADDVLLIVRSKYAGQDEIPF